MRLLSRKAAKGSREHIPRVGALSLQENRAIRFDVRGERDHPVEHLIELVVCCLEHQLLREEVHLHVLDALELGELLFQLARAVGAINLVQLV